MQYWKEPEKKFYYPWLATPIGPILTQNEWKEYCQLMRNEFYGQKESEKAVKKMEETHKQEIEKKDRHYGALSEEFKSEKQGLQTKNEELVRQVEKMRQQLEDAKRINIALQQNIENQQTLLESEKDEFHKHVTSLKMENQQILNKNLTENVSSNPKYIEIQKIHYHLTSDIIPDIVDLILTEVNEQNSINEIELEDVIISFLTFGCYSHISSSNIEITPNNVKQMSEHVANALVKKMQDLTGKSVSITNELSDKVRECVIFAIGISKSNPAISWIASTKAKYDTNKHEPSNFKLKISRIATPGLDVKDFVIAKAKVEILDNIK